MELVVGQMYSMEVRWMEDFVENIVWTTFIIYYVIRAIDCRFIIDEIATFYNGYDYYWNCMGDFFSEWGGKRIGVG